MEQSFLVETRNGHGDIEGIVIWGVSEEEVRKTFFSKNHGKPIIKITVIPGEFRVKTPKGYLMVENKGAEDEYPGVIVSLSKTGKHADISNMVACVEYLTGDDEIAVITYPKGQDQPNHIVVWEDGRDKLD